MRIPMIMHFSPVIMHSRVIMDFAVDPGEALPERGWRTSAARGAQSPRTQRFSVPPVRHPSLLGAADDIGAQGVDGTHCPSRELASRTRHHRTTVMRSAPSPAIVPTQSRTISPRRLA